ncbi:hypothetical protein EV421DRAFT_1985727 [Armillaria borealis]|uniref:F-box domain-containing protein n=1 Tax=Armillaria borealis TaxID=47425 RepID=A0AA39MI51_9AGAR|nr:hypothetical protein EV421DRAFT_1985727 [Armillaria borealis]
MFSTHRDFNKCPLCGPVERQAFPQSARAPRVLQLLQCNDAPSDTELSGFQETVRTAPARLAELDEKIAHARRNLDVLTLERISIEADMEDAKALSSPVRRLPPDILRAICLDIIPSPFKIMSTLDSHGSLNHTKPPWTLSQVCRSWRSTIVSSPELWSSMSLVLSNSFSSTIFSQMFMLGLRFERSQNAPLTVGCFSTSDISSHPLLSLVITRISTIKNLRIDSPYQSLAALSFGRGHLELLHDLKIKASNSNSGAFGAFSAFGQRSIDAFEYAPNLQRFSAYGMLPQPIPLIPWTQLTHFGLQIDHMRELEVLRQATNLQNLEIRTGGSFTTGEGYTPVSLPFLTSLTLASTKMSGGSSEIRFMFSLLSMPNLVNLHLIYAGMPVLPHIKARNTITTLEIIRLSTTTGGSTETYTFPGLLKLLNSVGNLQHLILRSAGALSSDDISLLNPSLTNASLPHLKTLDVRGCTFNFDHSIFVGMVNTRRGGSDTKWDQLETVYLGSSLVLDDFAAGIWQDLVDDGLKVVYGD